MCKQQQEEFVYQGKKKKMIYLLDYLYLSMSNHPIENLYPYPWNSSNIHQCVPIVLVLETKLLESVAIFHVTKPNLNLGGIRDTTFYM